MTRAEWIEARGREGMPREIAARAAKATVAVAAVFGKRITDWAVVRSVELSADARTFPVAAARIGRRKAETDSVSLKIEFV